MLNLGEVKLYSKNKTTEIELIDELQRVNEYGDKNAIRRVLSKIILYYRLTKNDEAKRYYYKIQQQLSENDVRNDVKIVTLSDIVNNSYHESFLLASAKMPKMAVSGLLHYVCDFTGVLKITTTDQPTGSIWLYLRVSCYHGGGVYPDNLAESIGCRFKDPFDMAIFAEIEQLRGEMKFIEVPEGIESMPGFKAKGDSVRHLLLDSMTKMDNFKAGIEVDGENEGVEW